VRKAAVPLLLALALAGCGRSEQQTGGKKAATGARTPAGVDQTGVTPMAQRVAVLGILNKRNGIVKDIALHPGQSARWKDLLVRLRACESTAPWEEEKLTGAFVQVDVQRPDRKWGRVFSGWLYKESPSLNTVEHPIYDVWPKSCEMTYPAGPAAPAAPVTSSNRSSAPKSAGAPARTPAAAEPATASPPPSAADSNAT
jgi:hypothetical protein